MLESVRDVVRERLDRQLARDELEHAALLDAGRVLGTDEFEDHRRLDRLVEPDAKQVQVHSRAADRVADEVLDDDRRAGRAIDLELEHGARVLQREPQRPLVDLEGDRVLAAAVDDPGDVPLASQAPRGARSGGVAVAYGEGCCLGCVAMSGERW